MNFREVENVHEVECTTSTPPPLPINKNEQWIHFLKEKKKNPQIREKFQDPLLLSPFRVNVVNIWSLNSKVVLSWWLLAHELESFFF